MRLQNNCEKHHWNAYSLASIIVAVVLFLALPISSRAQIFTNNGADIRVTPGGLVQINGSANNNLGLLDNDGETHITQNFTIGTTATTRGLGIMYVAGDWTNNGTFIASTVNGDGDESTIVWDGTAQNYQGTSVTTFWNLTVTGGNYKTFFQDARLNHIADFTNGWLRTTEADLITFSRTGQWTNASNSSHVDGPAAKEIDSAVEWHFPIGKVGRFNMAAITPLTTSFTTYRGEYFYQPYVNTVDVVAPLVAVSRVHYWHVDRISGSADARVRLYWIPGDYIPSWLMDPSSLVVARWNGAAWVSEGSSGYAGNYNSGNVISANFVNTFLTPNEPFTLGTLDWDNPLPVELAYFKAAQKGSLVDLTWKTEAEIENDGFEIERSSNGSDAQLIKSYKFDPDLRGKSFFGSDYQTNDRPEVEGTYVYDLYQQDRNGIRTKVASKTVDYKETYEGVSLTVEVYPNPASVFTRAMFTLDRDQYITVLIHDAAGRQLSVPFAGQLGSGPHEVSLPVSQLANGAYSVTIEAGSERVTAPLVISR